MDPLCMLAVHAHPDDESSKGAGTVARYHAEGVKTVLVTCTGGEEGDILNPAMANDEVRARLPELRREELALAAGIIGYDEVVWLGYRDSGMAGTPPNENPRSFAQAPLAEAVSRLVAVIRQARPQVVVTYPEEQSGYPHPDHLRVHEISVAAFDAAGDPEAYPDAGVPWQPLKLYYVNWSAKRMWATHQKFLELGQESPFGAEWLERLTQGLEAPVDHRALTIDITGYAGVSRRALLAHATQVDPTSRHWFGLPEDVADTLYPFDEYLLARNLTAAEPAAEDLFAGLRAPANR